MTKPIHREITVAELAGEHDASTLAAALLVRLRTEGHEESASAVAAALRGQSGILDPNPPDPHAR